jgi:xylose isomerase
MDAFARGLKLAAAIRKDGRISNFARDRYSSWDTGIGASIERGKTNFKDLEAYMLKKGDITPNRSGRQELLENIINELI